VEHAFDIPALAHKTHVAKDIAHQPLTILLHREKLPRFRVGTEPAQTGNAVGGSGRVVPPRLGRLEIEHFAVDRRLYRAEAAESGVESLKSAEISNKQVGGRVVAAREHRGQRLVERNLGLLKFGQDAVAEIGFLRHLEPAGKRKPAAQRGFGNEQLDERGAFPHPVFVMRKAHRPVRCADEDRCVFGEIFFVDHSAHSQNEIIG